MPDDDDDGLGGGTGGGVGDGLTHPYRPKFLSQFDDGSTHAYEMHNCVFASGAMALDRHTLGNIQVSGKQLREWSNNHRPVGASWQNLRHAWNKAAEEVGAAKGYSTIELEIARDPWDEVVARLKSGFGALVGGKIQEIPARYSCVCAASNRNAMHRCFKGNHALFINEVRENGDMLVFDSSCSFGDKLGDIDRSSLVEGWTDKNTEAQPKWVPSAAMRNYALTYTRSNKADVAYTRKTGLVNGPSGDIPTGDFYGVYTPGQWDQQARTPSAPGEPAILDKAWRQFEYVEGFFEKRVMEIADPAQIVAGEEGRVDDWQPTADGRGVQGRSYYTVPGKGVAFKTKETAWSIMPWDVPLDHFWLNPPPWPEGLAYLIDRLARHNRQTGVQAIGVVNRGDLWEKIELGAHVTLDLNLQGPHPGGFKGTVRVVGFMPDEDSGTMQVLTEWVTQPEDDNGDDPPDGSEAVEEVIADARSMQGVPWVLGKESRTECDCSGLIYRVFTDTGHGNLIGNSRKTAAGYTRWFADQGWFTQDRSVAKRGDLVVYAVAPTATHRVSHIGIYLGNDRVISALFLTGVTRHHIDAPTKVVKGILRVQYPDGPHGGPGDDTPEDPDDPDIPDDGGPPDGEDGDDPVTPPIGDPALVFYSMRVDGLPYVNGMFYSLCTLLRKLGYVVPKKYGMTLRIASGVPLKKNGIPQGTSVHDTKVALEALLPDADIRYGSMTNNELIDALADDSVIRVIAHYNELPQDLRRWIKDDKWKGNHAITLGKTRVHSGGIRQVFWMDPMGNISAGYSGEWVNWDAVKGSLLRADDGGVRVTYTGT